MPIPKTQFDVNRLITGWRREFDLASTYHIHEAASKQAFQAVLRFRRSNAANHAKRIWRKRQINLGKAKAYRHNRWIEPASLRRRYRKTTRLRSLNSRSTPKVLDARTMFLPGLGKIRLRTKIPDGKPTSFQMIDVTQKVTRRTVDPDCQFILCLQMNLPDPEPAGGPMAGLDLGVRHLAAVADECGNERLYGVPGGCRRHDGDRIDQLRSQRSRCHAGSRWWKELGRKLARELKKISGGQKHAEIQVARRITDGTSAILLEGLDLVRMRRTNGATSKTGLNMEMSYSRMGRFGTRSNDR